MAASNAARPANVLRGAAVALQEPIIVVEILQSVPEFPHPVGVDDRAGNTADHAPGHCGADA